MPTARHAGLLALVVLWSVAPHAGAQDDADAPRYDRVILGELVDRGTGAGISGEAIELRWVPPEAHAVYPAPWIPEYPRATRPVVATATSDADGHFGFEGLLPGTYELRPAAALSADPSPLQLTAAGPPPVVRIEVALGRHVRGRVVSARGGAVPRADVFVSHIEGQPGATSPHSLRTADLDGRFLLPGLAEGELWIEAYHPDHGFSAALRLSPGEDPEAADVELQLREEAARLWPPERRKFGGIGVSLAMTGAGPELASVQAGSPADRAGLRPGDRLAEIDGMPAHPMLLAELLMRCRGLPGTELRLRVERDGAFVDAVLTRVELQ